jgi:hypothetical protein
MEKAWRIRQNYSQSPNQKIVSPTGSPSEIARYQKDEGELQKKAREYEAQYDALNYRDDQFDLSDAALSTSIAMLAVTALTKKKWLLWTSLVIGVFGVVMGTAGLAGLRIHPGWLTKMLS